MTSIKTQLPFDYYAVPICKPENLQYKPENLGEVLRGDRIVNTLYDIKMAENKGCTILCAAKTLTAEESTKLTKLISDEYHVHMVIDNLPVATTFELEGKKQYDHGFKLGFGFDKDFYLNNHLKMTLKYHSYDKITFRVVGFEAETRSVARDAVGTKEGSNTCSFTSERPAGQVILPGKENSVLLTYEVKWEASEVVWASRWDTYLAMSDVQIHWFAIVNSVVIVLFLSGGDIGGNRLEVGTWRCVQASPEGLALDCICWIWCADFLHGGDHISVCYAWYVITRKSRESDDSHDFSLCLHGTATLYPGVISIDCFILNFFIWGQHSSGAVPFTTMLALMCMWLGISTPLVFLGYYFGFRKYPYEHPVRTNQIPRQVPEQPWFISPIPSNLLAGILPFGAVFIELFFILSDYHWWWRSFFMSGSCSIYVFFYAVFYFVTKLEIEDFVPGLLYFGYTCIMVLSFWLLTGTVGFYATYIFIRHIYAAVKID
ncbi:Transmembrane 9 superfamily member 4 [Acropora cervicornis]|uniref:Transmembrane 9 superfamily member n=1 Tax=Acropora cervicornis TaxID=6130 RepID=A0AAD9R6G2_ACRCE|nr:Transmembrane 9 superfamily member 4 [Acropora cervicornis]